MTIFRGLTLVYTDGNPISSLTDNQLFHMFGQGYFAGIPVPAVVMLLMFALCWFILNKTPLGRKTYAVGGNEKVSFIAGIKIERIKIFAYAITGLFCALAGAILTSRLNSAQPTAGTGYELDAIAAVAFPAAKAVSWARLSAYLLSVPLTTALIFLTYPAFTSKLSKV